MSYAGKVRLIGSVRITNDSAFVPNTNSGAFLSATPALGRAVVALAESARPSDVFIVSPYGNNVGVLARIVTVDRVSPTQIDIYQFNAAGGIGVTDTAIQWYRVFDG